MSRPAAAFVFTSNPGMPPSGNNGGTPRDPKNVSSYKLVQRYVCAIPYRRRLSRQVAKLFVVKILEMMNKVENANPQFFDDVAKDLILRIPRSKSRGRQILAEIINSVLEELGIFHSRRDSFIELPDDWDVTNTTDGTAEESLDIKEQIQIMHDALEAIDPRSAWLIKAHYIDGRTLAYIGRETGLSKSRVGEIIAQARSALATSISTIRYNRPKVPPLY